MKLHKYNPDTNLYKCPKCKKWLQKTEFYPDKSQHHGIQSWCKKCQKPKNHEYHRRNKERINKRKREHYKNNLELMRNRARKYREENREKWTKMMRESQRRKRKQVEELLGDSCTICGLKPKKGQRGLTTHEIHGKPHIPSPYFVFKNSENFVMMCILCHKALHRYHQYKTKMEELEKLLKD